MPCLSKRHPAFNMVELLVALTIIGLISIFFIPKVLNSLNNDRRNTALREVSGMLATVLQEGVENDSLAPANFGTFFMQRINAATMCNANANTEGCLTTAQGLDTNDETQPGFVLHSGTTVAGFDDNCCNGPGAEENFNTLLVDWDGQGGQNQVGVDRLLLVLCFGETECSAPGPAGQDSGTVAPYSQANGSFDVNANIALYNATLGR